MSLDSKVVFLLLAGILVAGLMSTSNVYAAKNAIPTITPTSLTAIAVSPTQIDLSWLAPTQNYGKTIIGYKIEERLGGGVYSEIVENTGSVITKYSLTGLTTGVSYVYRVSAIYSDDTSTDPSNSATATPTLSSRAPPTPSLTSPITNVKLDFIPSDGTVLSSVIVTQNDYLQLQYKKDPRSIMQNAVPTIESVNNNLDHILTYQNNHLSQDSVPAPLVAKSVSPNQINLSWLPPIETYGQHILGYKIEIKNAPGDYQSIDDNTGNETTYYSITGLNPGTSYTYRVSAVYEATHSNPSNEATVTTLEAPRPIQTPPSTTPQSSSGQSSAPSNAVSAENNVHFDFTAPDGTQLSGVILTQSDYQQLLVIKDPRAIISNVGQTGSTINNSLAGIIRYQNIHTVQQSVPVQTSPVANSSMPAQDQPSNNNGASLSLVQGVITSVVATGVVGLVTWFVKTKVARKIAKEYHFTLEKSFTPEGLLIRIRNSGETIEDCTILCDRDICMWSDTHVDKPRHVYEGSVSSAIIPKDLQDKNPLMMIKTANKVLRKIHLDDMAHG